MIEYYNLDNDEFEWAWEEGKRRLYHTTSRPLDGGGDELEESVRGVMSEYSICQLYRSEFDDNLYVDRSKAPQADTEVAGLTVSVKSTKMYPEPNLLIRPNRLACELYVLVTVDVYTGATRRCGCATREDVMSKPCAPWNTKKPVHRVPRVELRPLPNVDLVRAGWRPKVRCNKFIWEKPDGSAWVSEGIALMQMQ